MPGKFIRVNGRVVPVKDKGSAAPKKPQKPPKSAVKIPYRQKKAAGKPMAFGIAHKEVAKGKLGVFAKALGIQSVGNKK